MGIVPVVNSGAVPQVRRPRITISEGTAISGPFPIALRCTQEGFFRPGPNDISVISPRCAITASAEPPQTFPWGQTYGVADSIGTTPVLVGYLWIRSLDGNADGYDDLEANGLVTIAQAFTTLGDLVQIIPNTMSGSGIINLTGSGELVANNPLAGSGEIALSAQGAFIVVGQWSGTGELHFGGDGAFVANNPMAGVGLLELSGAGSATALNPLSTITGLTATPGDASVALAWTAHTAVAGLTYTIQRSTASDFSANLVTWTGITGTSYTNNAAGGNAPVNGTPYWYRIRAVAPGWIDGQWAALGSSVTPVLSGNTATDGRMDATTPSTITTVTIRGRRQADGSHYSVFIDQADADWCDYTIGRHSSGGGLAATLGVSGGIRPARVRLEIIGSTIRVLTNTATSGGTWTQLLTTTDTVIPGSGLWDVVPSGNASTFEAG